VERARARDVKGGEAGPRLADGTPEQPGRGFREAPNVHRLFGLYPSRSIAEDSSVIGSAHFAVASVIRFHSIADGTCSLAFHKEHM